MWTKGSCLKELRHEDFVILGQVCAKIITQCFYSYTKCSCKTMRKISNELYPEEPTIIIFLVIFEDVASKLEKNGAIFSSFNPFPSLPSVATDNRKQFQCHNIVFNNKELEHYFGNLIDAKTLFRFLKRY